MQITTLDNAKIVSGFMNSEYYRIYRLAGRKGLIETSFKHYMMVRNGLAWVEAFHNTEEYSNLLSDVRLAESLK
jgi:hypothetical protein